MKLAVLAALSNVQVLYMTQLSGLAHDRWGIVTMLAIESGLATSRRKMP